MEATSLMTPAGLESLRAELEALEGEGRREIAERIKTAREWGDLKENSEYHDAKNDQAHLETKIARLREKISAAVVVEESEGPGADGTVGFGSTVTVRDQNGGSARGGSSAPTTPPPRRGASRSSPPSPAPSWDATPVTRPRWCCPADSPC